MPTPRPLHKPIVISLRTSQESVADQADSEVAGGVPTDDEEVERNALPSVPRPRVDFKKPFPPVSESEIIAALHLLSESKCINFEQMVKVQKVHAAPTLPKKSRVNQKDLPASTIGIWTSVVAPYLIEMTTSEGDPWDPLSDDDIEFVWNSNFEGLGHPILSTPAIPNSHGGADLAGDSTTLFKTVKILVSFCQ